VRYKEYLVIRTGFFNDYRGIRRVREANLCGNNMHSRVNHRLAATVQGNRNTDFNFRSPVMTLLHFCTRRRAVDTSIDLTPMLDVVFILLIFFVVTAISFDESSMPLESQQPLPADNLLVVIPDNVLIVVKADKRVVFNGETIDIRAVRPRLALVLARNPEAAVIIRPEPGSLANELVTIADAARRAGVENIKISE
jgi:biopolymer transport protein ExbD